MKLASVAPLVVLLTSIFDFASASPIDREVVKPASSEVQTRSYHGFRIDFRRSNIVHCTKASVKAMGKAVEIKDGQCRSWKDDKPFRAFEYKWKRSGVKTENPDYFGECKLHLYEDSNCGGQKVDRVSKVNTYENLGMCFTETQGWLGPAKSVRLLCNE